MTFDSAYSGGWRWIEAIVSARHFGLGLALVLSSLLVAMVALYSTSTGRVTETNASAAPAATAAPDSPRLAIESGALKKMLNASARGDNVDALVGAVAKKYRVSHHALREFVDTAYAEAKRNRIDPLLVIAVIAVESRFNPVAQSDHGATGLMQVIPRYHADKFSEVNGESVLDPRTNIKVGAQVLKEYIVRGGNEAAGLQLYNGSSVAGNAYALRVMGERQRLLVAMRRGRADKSVRLLALS